MIEHQALESFASQDERGSPDVLIVEDDPEINELIGAYVELSGFPCRRVMRGEDALREVREHRPGLMVLDVMLPDLDGFEICRRIRADSNTATIPIIMLTALDPEQTRCRAIECGASDYLTKPFDPDRLMAAIRRHVENGGHVAAHSMDGI